jgi:hypothetical protein
MNPKPLSSLNHFTVPVAMFTSTASVLRTPRMQMEQPTAVVHYFSGPFRPGRTGDKVAVVRTE